MFKITNTCRDRIHRKPWLAKGLLNACKRNKYLCKQFINDETKMNEIYHKKYKNNLVNILRNHKRTYYNKSLKENKTDNNKFWRIINEVMRNKKNSQTYTSEYTQNGIRLTNNTDIENEFNKFFTNIGMEITNSIPSISS